MGVVYKRDVSVVLVCVGYRYGVGGCGVREGCRCGAGVCGV